MPKENECDCDDDCTNECGEDCDCEHGEVSMEDLVYGSYTRIDALVQLLIDKKIITEAEFEKKVEEILEKEAEESEEE